MSQGKIKLACSSDGYSVSSSHLFSSLFISKLDELTVAKNVLFI